VLAEKAVAGPAKSRRAATSQEVATGSQDKELSLRAGRFAAAVAACGNLPLIAPPQLTVRGVSQLRIAAGASGRREHIDLGWAARAAAGPNAIWFGTWVHGKDLYWALLATDGSWNGVTPFTTGPLASAMRILHDALPIARRNESRQAMSRRVSAGPFWRDQPAEEELAESLGCELLPPPLTERLVAGDHPLVVAVAAELAAVPWPLLVVPGADGATGKIPEGSSSAPSYVWRCQWR